MPNIGKCWESFLPEKEKKYSSFLVAFTPLLFFFGFSLIGLFSCEFIPKTYAEEKNTSEENNGMRKGIKFAAFPVFSLTTDEGLKLGAITKRFDYGDGNPPFNTLTSVGGAYATRGPRLVFVEFEKTRIGKHKLRMKSLIYTLTNPHQNFFGVGDSTKVDPDSEDGFYDYTSRTYRVSTSLRKKFKYAWEPFVALDFVRYDLDSNSDSSQFFTEFGRKNDVFAAKLAIGLIQDQRNLEFIPSSGHYLYSAFVFSPSPLNSIDTYYHWNTDFRHYLKIVENRWLWLANQFQYRISTTSTPLPEKASLGSKSTLRGIPLDRYISNQIAIFRSELRSVIIRTRLFGLPVKGGMGIFGDTGRTGNNFARLFETPTRFGWGVSFFGSYFTDDFLGAVDLGFSRKERALYISLAHAF